MAVWENVHACDFTHSRKLHRRIFRTVEYVQHPQKYEPVEVSSLATISEFRFVCTDLYENGDGYIPFVLEVNIDEHQSFHGLA